VRIRLCSWDRRGARATSSARFTEDPDWLSLGLATLRVYLEGNTSPLRASHRLGVDENTITNRIRAAPELLPHPIEHRSAELLVALRLMSITHDA
jgi:hypothetical protein